VSGSSGKFLDTRGNGTLGIAICDRCATKRAIPELMSDPNAPGLKVCRNPAEGCIDRYDPYRMPARTPDPIALPFYRPDAPLESGPDVTDWLRDDTPEHRRVTEVQRRNRKTEQNQPRVTERKGS